MPKIFLCILFWNNLFLCFTLVWETKFHIYSEQRAIFYVLNWKTKYYGPSGSGYSLHTMCSKLIHSHNFDFFVSSPNIELCCIFIYVICNLFVSFCPSWSSQNITMNCSLTPERISTQFPWSERLHPIYRGLFQRLVWSGHEPTTNFDPLPSLRMIVSLPTVSHLPSWHTQGPL
jgi:hypothetical protein